MMGFVFVCTATKLNFSNSLFTVFRTKWEHEIEDDNTWDTIDWDFEIDWETEDKSRTCGDENPLNGTFLFQINKTSVPDSSDPRDYLNELKNLAQVGAVVAVIPCTLEY